MTVPVMYGRTALTGGGAGALDAIDGTALVEGDMCLVVMSTGFSVYYLNATSGAAESSPNIIAPDTNAGNKRWILKGVCASEALFTSGSKIYLDGGGDTYISEAASNVLSLFAGGIEYSFGTAVFRPVADNNSYLGLTNNRWVAVYAVNGAIQTSDKIKKTNIENSDLGLDFILGLKPSKFEFKDTPGEVRHGLIAQDIVQAAKGKSTGGILFGDEGDYGLNYASFAVPLISAVQEQNAKIKAMESKIERLENKE